MSKRSPSNIRPRSVRPPVPPYRAEAVVAAGESVTLKGWLYNKRSSGKLAFLQLRDGTGIVQCVVFKPNNEALFDIANSIGQESSIVVTGTVKEDTRSSIGVELDVKALEVLQNAHDYPILIEFKGCGKAWGAVGKPKPLEGELASFRIFRCARSRRPIPS